jgi:oxepin-CoA hydrolase/3-oxo-5,6-dehydrosuberyl-CoA semialdehyde dehydrogenase
MQQQIQFLQQEFLTILKTTNSDTVPKWGKMNLQQMLEHLVAFFKVSTGQLKFELVSPPEQLPKLKAFLLSDKPFRENTKAPANIIGEEPRPVYYASVAEALATLEKEVAVFISYYETHPAATELHPVFGELNFEEWVLLHYKHVTHHLRQFALLE